jgi:cobalamin synthase
VHEPLAVLAALGGLEIATMAGAVLQAAQERRLVVVDGFHHHRPPWLWRLALQPALWLRPAACLPTARPKAAMPAGCAVALGVQRPLLTDLGPAPGRGLGRGAGLAADQVGRTAAGIEMASFAIIGTNVDGGMAVLGITLPAAALVVVGMRRWLRQRLGGYTGDTLGAAEQLAEAAILMVWVAVIGL